MGTYIDIFGDTLRCNYNYIKEEKEIPHYGDGSGYPGAPPEVNDLVIYDVDRNSITDDFTDHEIELIKEKIIEIEIEIESE